MFCGKICTFCSSRFSSVLTKEKSLKRGFEESILKEKERRAKTARWILVRGITTLKRVLPAAHTCPPLTPPPTRTPLAKAKTATIQITPPALKSCNLEDHLVLHQAHRGPTFLLGLVESKFCFQIQPSQSGEPPFEDVEDLCLHCKFVWPHL